MTENAFDNHILEWTAPEYIKHQRGPVWIGIAGSLSAAMIAYAILSGSWTMAMAFLALSIAYYIEHKQEPEDIETAFSEMGIKVGNQVFPFSIMKAFWIIYEPPFVKTLHIRFAKKHMADLTIQLGDQDPAKARNYLATQIPEWEGKEEATFDILTRTFKL